MKRNPNSFLITILLFAFGVGPLYSQTEGETISSSQIRNIIERVNGPDPRLVSGKLYRGARQGSVAGHPYYIDENWKTGFVIIDGILFDNLLLKYDVFENKLVLNTTNISKSAVLLCLNLEKTKRFGMNGRNFIPFPPEKDTPEPRFSESVVDDTLSFLILKRKDLKVEGGSVDYSYETYEDFYLLYNNELVKFRNRRTLFSLFPDLKDALKKYIRRENLTFIKKRSGNLSRLTLYCNTLLNNSQ